MDFGNFALRTTVGSLFVGHGAQKLFGWFGGHGLEGTAQFFESGLGLRPGKRHATLAGAGEAGGGALLMLGGKATPLGTAALTGAMTTAIRKVHAPNGPWNTEQGWEYNAVLIAAAAAVTSKETNSLTAILAVAAGIAGSYLATEVLNEPAPEESSPAPTDSVSSNGVPVGAQA